MNRDAIFEVIKQNMAEIIEEIDPSQVAHLQESDSMMDLGADSLEIIEVVSRSMKQLRLRVPRPRLAEARNLGELIDLFEEVAAETAVQA